MGEQMHIAASLSSMEADKAMYDKKIKELLSDKQILARILKYSVDELADMTAEEIAASIVGRIDVSQVPVDPGLTNCGRLQGENNEDSVVNEGFITYDIRFAIFLKENQCRILLNLEAQKETDPKKLRYPFEKRIVFYLCRMISAQKQVEFFKSDYGNIKKVISIWICLDNGAHSNSINEIYLEQRSKFGEPERFEELDLMRAIVIRIRDRQDVRESENIMIAMLEDLIRQDPLEKKKSNLSEKYGIKMTYEVERKVANMCNWSDAVEERAIQKGMAQGMQQGMAQGMQQGIQRGMEQEKIVAIQNMVKFGVPKEKILTEYSQEEYDTAVAPA